MASPCCG